MNVINKLTLQYMKQNKSRTLVTIIGVIISVAMISATSTIAVSFMNMMQRSTITYTGDWHAVFMGVSGNNVETIIKSDEVKKSMITHEIGYGILPNSMNSQAPYVYITEYNNFDLTALNLMEGQYPINDNEIAISTQLLETSGVNYKIGDRVSFELGTRSILINDTVNELDHTSPYMDGEQFHPTSTKSYTITGIVDATNKKNTVLAAYPIFAGMNEAHLPQNETYSVYTRYHQLNSKIYSITESIATSINVYQKYYNSELLLYAGISSDDYFVTTMRIITIIVGIIILIGSVSLIYNAFAISLSERSRTLGMLASVGATKKQKRSSVLFEGTIIGCIALPIGLVSGYAGIGITFSLMNPIVKEIFRVSVPLKLIITPYGLVGSILFSLFVLFLSAWFPALRASKITPIEAIRQTREITVRGKDIKTLGLTKIIFGFEAELGLKNIKRNKHRYYATLLSLIISIVLFLTASGFSLFIKTSFQMTQAPRNYDLVVYINNLERGNNTEYVNELGKLKSAHSNVITKYIYGDSELTKDQISPDALKRISPYEGAYYMTLSIISLDDTYLKDYAKKVGIDYNKLQNDALQGILVNNIVLKEDHYYSEVTQLNVKEGDYIPFRLYDDNNKEWTNEIKIVSLADVLPICMDPYQETISGITILVSEQSMKALYNKLQAEGYTYPINSKIYYLTDTPNQLENEIEATKKNYTGVSSYTFNVQATKQQLEHTSLIFSIFLYGFVILIAIVCTANIINTISTSVQLRKREFAMLKSFGLTPSGFQRMIKFESIFYGLKALLYGLPISFVMIYFIYRALGRSFDFAFFLPWGNIILSVVCVFLIVSITMLYAIRKTKKENIIDALKNENL